MGRHRTYPSNASRQAAYRARQVATRAGVPAPVRLGDCTLYCGDALQVVPQLGRVDHVLTDPPYEAEAHTRTRRTRATLEGRVPSADIPFPPMTDEQRSLLASLACGWLLIFCQVEASGQYQRLFGARYKRTAVWVKPDGAPQFTGDRPAIGHEHIACLWSRTGRSVWNGGGKRGVYTHNVHDGQPRLHPTQKPLPLLKELLRDFTQPGDLVLDPFMGSGSTGVACLETGRRFVGVELDPAMYGVACRRIETVTRQGTLFAAD